MPLICPIQGKKWLSKAAQCSAWKDSFNDGIYSALACIDGHGAIGWEGGRKEGDEAEGANAIHIWWDNWVSRSHLRGLLPVHAVSETQHDLCIVAHRCSITQHCSIVHHCSIAFYLEQQATNCWRGCCDEILYGRCCPLSGGYCDAKCPCQSYRCGFHALSLSWYYHVISVSIEGGQIVCTLP